MSDSFFPSLSEAPLHLQQQNHSLAKIVGKRHSRQLLYAAGIMNKNATDLGSRRDPVCS
jgi:hypothetical protein